MHNAIRLQLVGLLITPMYAKLSIPTTFKPDVYRTNSCHVAPLDYVRILRSAFPTGLVSPVVLSAG